MKKISGMLVMLFFFLSSCQNDQIREELMPEDEYLISAKEIFAPLISYQVDPAAFISSNLRRGDLVERPIKFRSAGTLTFILDSEICGDDEYTQINQTLIEGEGFGSHMGNISVHLSYCWHYVTNGMELDSYVTGKVVASNGDEIYVVLTGSGTDENGYFQNYQILDGTGRFTAVTGSYTLYGTIDYVNGIFQHEGEGTIWY